MDNRKNSILGYILCNSLNTSSAFFPGVTGCFGSHNRHPSPGNPIVVDFYTFNCGWSSSKTLKSACPSFISDTALTASARPCRRQRSTADLFSCHGGPKTETDVWLPQVCGFGASVISQQTSTSHT